jgi:hypothetical protein
MKPEDVLFHGLAALNLLALTMLYLLRWEQSFLSHHRPRHRPRPPADAPAPGRAGPHAIEWGSSVTDVHIWMALDPETRRVLTQSREFADGDFPPGLRGVGWPRREADVPGELYARLLTGGPDPAEQDRLHRDWWDAARAEAEPRWPLLPGEE